MVEGQKPNSGRRRITWIIVGVILVSLCVTPILMSQRARNNQTPGQSNENVVAFAGDLSASITAGGWVEANRRASLNATSPARVESLTVRPGDIVQSGDLLMRLDDTSLSHDVDFATQNLALKEANLMGLLEPPAESQLAAAQAAVASAQAALDDLLAGPSVEELLVKEADLKAASASVTSAESQLTQVQNAVKAANIAAAEAAVAAAGANLKNVEIRYSRNPSPDNIQANTALNQARELLSSAEARLLDLRGGPDQNQVSSAQAGVAAALARQDSAQAQLDKLEAPPSISQVANLEAQIAQAKANLVNLTNGPTPEAMAAAQAEVDQALIALEGAQAALEGAHITAPFDGLITAVNFSEGEIANGQVIEVVDHELLEVVLEVDEIDVGGLLPGQPALLSLEAWPDLKIDSEIVSIAPSASTTPGSSLVSYEVHLTLPGEGIPVLLGTTANATLVTAIQKGVLLVPNQAIVADRAKGTFSVRRVAGEEIETVTVTIGLRDNQYSQITSGLEVGDELLAGEVLTNDLLEGHQNGFFFGGS